MNVNGGDLHLFGISDKNLVATCNVNKIVLLSLVNNVMSYESVITRVITLSIRNSQIVLLS